MAETVRRMLRSAKSSNYLSDQLALPFHDGAPQGSSGSGRRRLRVVGVFAGIGGIELGLHRAKHQTTLLCEIEPAARAVLDARFPDVPKHADIRTLERLPPGTDLLAGGFPCQDLSQAGRTAGIVGAQSGLVEQIFRLLEVERTPWVLLENVPFMLQLGGGKAMNLIADALEQLGYRWAYRVVDSRAFGVPQRRERVYFVASLREDPRRVLFADEAGDPAEATETAANVACGFYWTEGIRGLGWAVDAIPTLKGGSTIGVPSPPAILLPSGQIVKPSLVDAERLQGFPKNWTEPAERVAKRAARWKLVGNAVSVPAAVWLGRRLASPGPFALRNARPLAPDARWPRAAWNNGEGRWTADISAWPKRARPIPLDRFLSEEPDLLSVRATAGFLERTTRSSLRFPPGFIDAVKAHLQKMEQGERDGTDRS